VRSPWFDSLIIGSQFLYSEGGAQTVVRLVHKEVRQDSGTELVALTLEAVYPVRYGIYKEIEPGEVWDVSALLGNTGFPNAFSPWHVAPVPENVSERIDLVPRSERFAKPRNIAPQQRRAMLNALREVNGETVQLHLHSQIRKPRRFSARSSTCLLRPVYASGRRTLSKPVFRSHTEWPLPSSDARGVPRLSGGREGVCRGRNQFVGSDRSIPAGRRVLHLRGCKA
jgi:hypothetical protein